MINETTAADHAPQSSSSGYDQINLVPRQIITTRYLINMTKSEMLTMMAQDVGGLHQARECDGGDEQRDLMMMNQRHQQGAIFPHQQQQQQAQEEEQHPAPSLPMEEQQEQLRTTASRRPSALAVTWPPPPPLEQNHDQDHKQLHGVDDSSQSNHHRTMSNNQLLSGTSLHSTGDVSIDTVDGTAKSPRRTIKLRKTWCSNNSTPDQPRDDSDSRPAPPDSKSLSSRRRSSGEVSSGKQLRRRRKLKAQWPPKIKTTTTTGSSVHSSSSTTKNYKNEELKNIKVNVKQRRSVFLDPMSFEKSSSVHTNASSGASSDDSLLDNNEDNKYFPRVKDRRQSFEPSPCLASSSIKKPSEQRSTNNNKRRNLEELVDCAIHVVSASSADAATDKVSGDDKGDDHPHHHHADANSNTAGLSSDDDEVQHQSATDVNDPSTAPLVDFTLPSGQKLPKGSAKIYGKKRRKKRRRTNYRIRYDGPTSLRLEDIYGNLMAVPEDEFSDEGSLDGKDRFRIRDDSNKKADAGIAAPPSRPKRCPHTPTGMERKALERSPSGESEASADQAPMRPGRRGSRGRIDMKASSSSSIDSAPSMPGRHRYRGDDSSDPEEGNFIEDSKFELDELYVDNSEDYEETSEVGYFEETNDPHRLQGHRPDIWVTPMPSALPETAPSWKVKRVWNVKEVDEQEYEHNVKNEDLFSTVKSLLGAEDAKGSNSAPASEAAAKGTPWHLQKFMDVDGQVEESDEEVFLKEEDMEMEMTTALVEECQDEFVCSDHDDDDDEEEEGLDDDDDDDEQEEEEQEEEVNDHHLTDNKTESLSNHRERAYNRPNEWVAKPQHQRSWKAKRALSAEPEKIDDDDDDNSKTSSISGSVSSSLGGGWTSGLSGKIRTDVSEGRLENPKARGPTRARGSK
jgi:hypothetical protein